jgi:GNAT superfamily N-acetyltransferase
LVQNVSCELLERFVFAKLYFDYTGLIIACDDGTPVGFSHAGFGPDDEEKAVSTELGTTGLVLVRPDCDEAMVAAALLEQSEKYLRARGAKVIYGGGIRPLNAFYLGMYGGSEVPGVLESDTVAQHLYTTHGYKEIDRTILLERDLATFEAPIDRRQMQVRRQTVVEVASDPPTRTWWDACTLGEFDLTRFDAVPRGGGTPIASATFRAMELMPSTGARRSMGLIDVWVEDSFRRRGMAVFLLCEAFRQFARQGAETIEIQAMQHNLAALGLYRKLGFRQCGQGSVFRKEA